MGLMDLVTENVLIKECKLTEMFILMILLLIRIVTTVVLIYINTRFVFCMRLVHNFNLKNKVGSEFLGS